MLENKLTLEVLVATTGQTDKSLIKKMNLRCDAVIANQADINDICVETTDNKRIKTITTTTRGVGINRNIAILASDADILLFADDDVKYNDDYVENVLKAFIENPNAEMMIFGMNLTRNGKVYKTIKNKTSKAKIYQALKYGTYVLAIKKDSLLKANVFFSELFGGGTKYSCGEDSLFIVDCFRKKLAVYTHAYILGECSKDTSSWFEGYNEKFFFDKGAWIACAFPRTKNIVKFYYVFRFCKRTELSLKDSNSCISKGKKAFTKGGIYCKND